jgi:REP element-mobilizing transposase RayT
MFYRRRLPHVWSTDQPIFLTWRLYGSLLAHRSFPEGTLTSGKAFAAMDRLLDEVSTGPSYLRLPVLADMVVETIRYESEVLKRCVVPAFVVMPNHVHLLVTASVPLPTLTKSLKGFTAKRANTILAQTGKPFWQEESYDHVVRREGEFERIRQYIEQNPVRAGLVHEAAEYRWSSAGLATRRSPAGREARPTKSS